MSAKKVAASNPMLRLATLLGFLGLAAACADCGSVPNTDDDAGQVGGGNDLIICGSDDDCENGALCMGGLCEVLNADAGPGVEPDPEGDAGPPAAAQLNVLPDSQLEFGAQLLGVAVVRDLQLQNSGTAPLTILAIILDQDGDEFAVTPSGTLGEVLEPGDVMLLQVSHTPIDAAPDQAELKILHDGPGNLATVALFAEFKGNAVFSVTGDLAQIDPSIDTYAFGEVTTGVPNEAVLWLRNTGASDSLVEILDLTITPPTVGFSFASDPELPLLLGAWSTGLCPSGTADFCPEGASACTDGVCLDAAGLPVAALALPIIFQTEGLAANATLTIEVDEGDGPIQRDVALSGLPTQPQLVVTPSEALFGSQLVGSPTPNEITIDVGNTGAGNLLITLVELPSNAAFVVTPSAPIPTQAGHPPLSLAMGDTPLTLTVEFLPAAAEGYADILTLYTNDDTQLVVPLALSGSGVVCQENASVNAATGVCECLAGFNACGGECLADSPSSCGSACTDCTLGLGAGTDATCDVGSCSFSCATRYYDIDDDLDSPNDPGWTGCEYLCPSPLFDSEIAACQADPNLACEQCNGVDDDCDGQRDEGMDPDSADLAADNGGSCLNFTDLGDVEATTSGASSNWNVYSIYPTGDDDWFKITVTEGSESPSCAEELPCLEGGTENYTTRFELTSPGAEAFELEILIPNKETGNYDNCTGSLEGAAPLTGTDITHAWSRSSDLLDCAFCLFFDACWEGGYGCAFDDKQVYFVRVKAAPGAASSFSCETYDLSITTTAVQ